MSVKISIQNISVVNFIRSIYKTDVFIPLHEPRLLGNEKKYLNECIDSTFVSSVGLVIGNGISIEMIVFQYHL